MKIRTQSFLMGMNSTTSLAPYELVQRVELVPWTPLEFQYDAVRLVGKAIREGMRDVKATKVEGIADKVSSGTSS